MEWSIIGVLLIINAALGGQQLLLSLARNRSDQSGQPKDGSGKPAAPTQGLPEMTTAVVITWWRELFKLSWAVVAVAVEAVKGRPWREFWPGVAAVLTVSICSFTGVIENFGFVIIAKYSPHLWAPSINVYLLLLPIFTGLMFGSTVTKQHWIGTVLVLIGLAVPYVRLDSLEWLRHVIMSSGEPKHGLDSLDTKAIIWIIVINLCLCSQQVLNNKSVQLATRKVSANAFVVWREIFKFGYASLALAILAFIANVNVKQYVTGDWMVIVFALGAGLTGYIYSWGFFVLSKYPVHTWVPYTNLYVVCLPFLSVWLLPNVNVRMGHILGTIIVGVGMVIGMSGSAKHKIERITDKQG